MNAPRLDNKVTFHNRPGRPDKYSKIGPSTCLTVRIPIAMRDAIKEESSARGVSAHGFVRNAIASYINFLREVES